MKNEGKEFKRYRCLRSPFQFHYCQIVNFKRRSAYFRLLRISYAKWWKTVRTCLNASSVIGSNFVDDDIFFQITVEPLLPKIFRIIRQIFRYLPIHVLLRKWMNYAAKKKKVLDKRLDSWLFRISSNFDTCFDSRIFLVEVGIRNYKRKWKCAFAYIFLSIKSARIDVTFFRIILVEFREKWA